MTKKTCSYHEFFPNDVGVRCSSSEDCEVYLKAKNADDFWRDA